MKKRDQQEKCPSCGRSLPQGKTECASALCRSIRRKREEADNPPVDVDDRVREGTHEVYEEEAEVIPTALPALPEKTESKSRY